MIFLKHDTEPALSSEPADISARDLLASCSFEIRRQAQVMSDLDAALGMTLDLLRRLSLRAEPRPEQMSRVVADLQRFDQLRQEVEGLASVLDLLAGLESLSEMIRSETVRTCTPLASLQHRLILPSFARARTAESCDH